MEAAVNIQADEIVRALNVAGISVEHAQGKWKPAVLQQAQKGFVEELVHQRGDPAIRSAPYRLQHDIVMRPPDLSVRLQLVNRAIRAQMGSSHRAYDAHRCSDITASARGKFAGGVSHGRVHVGLIEGQPTVAILPERFDYHASETFKELRGIGA